MKYVKCLLTVCCVVLLTAGVSQAQTGTMALFSDQDGTDCNVSDHGGSTCPILVYVIYKGPATSTGSEFMLYPAGGAALIYLGESLPIFNSVSAGRADTGIAIAHGGCKSGPLHVLTVIYQGIGASDKCSRLEILPDPRSPHQNGFNIAMVSCQFTIFYAAAGYLTVNPTDDCRCVVGPGGTPTPTFDTSWGQIKSLYVAN